MQDSQPVSYPTALLVGVSEIDSDHQAIFRQIATALTALRTGEGTLRHTFRMLIDAFRMHFNEEERLMTMAGYRGIGRHVQHHADFMARLEALAEKGDGESEIAREANFDALDTLFRDALNGDTEFANWLKAR